MQLLADTKTKMCTPVVQFDAIIGNILTLKQVLVYLLSCSWTDLLNLVYLCLIILKYYSCVKVDSKYYMYKIKSTATKSFTYME